MAEGVREAPKKNDLRLADDSLRTISLKTSGSYSTWTYIKLQEITMEDNTKKRKL